MGVDVGVGMCADMCANVGTDMYVHGCAGMQAGMCEHHGLGHGPVPQQPLRHQGHRAPAATCHAKHCWAKNGVVHGS